MTIETVGDLIRFLTRFDPELPVVKFSQLNDGYEAIPVINRNEYRIKPAVIDTAQFAILPVQRYQDASVADPHSFNALVL